MRSAPASSLSVRSKVAAVVVVLAAVLGLWFVRAHGGTRMQAADPLLMARRATNLPATPAATASLWGPSACQMQTPPGDGRHRTVFLDAGHGNPDPGTSGVTSAGQTIYEKDVTLAIMLNLAELLRADGYTVVLARTADTSVAPLTPADTPGGVFSVAGKHKDLEARVACANAAHAQVLVSLHFNGYSDPSVGGTETFYDDARSFSAQNRQLAQFVQHDVVAQLGAAGFQTSDRGASPDSSDVEPTLGSAAAAYHHLLELGPAQPGYLDAPSAMPGVLCEALFLTNPHDATIAASSAGQQAIARGIAAAIEQFSP